MINVSISVDNYLLTQGVNSVVDQFFYNKKSFKLRGINICATYDYKSIYNSIPHRTGKGNENLIRERIKKKLKGTFFYKTFFVEMLLIVFKMILRGKKTCKNYIRNNNDNVLICQDAFMGYFFLKYKEKRNVSMLPSLIYMTHIHDDELEQILINYPKIKGTVVERKVRNIFEYVHKKSDVIVTICNSAKDSLKNEVRDKNICVIYNSVQDINVKRKQVNYSNIKFVMASSLTNRKGMDLLVKSLEKMDSNIGVSCEFHIFGDGMCFEMLDDIRNKLRNIKVKLYGRVEKPYNYYEDKDVFLMTSRDECLPMSILEAMSCSMPIVSTNIGAVNELVIDGVNGILMKPQVNSITSTIHSILLGKYNLDQMGLESRERFLRKFSAEQWCKAFSNVIESV